MIDFRGVIIVATVTSAFGAGWMANGWRIESGVLRAEREARANAEASNQTIIAAYRGELDRARNRPPVRVRVCPDLSAAPGGAADPASAGVSAGAGRDITDLLLECRAYVAQLGALIQTVKR